MCLSLTDVTLKGFRSPVRSMLLWSVLISTRPHTNTGVLLFQNLCKNVNDLKLFPFLFFKILINEIKGVAERWREGWGWEREGENGKKEGGGETGFLQRAGWPLADPGSEPISILVIQTQMPGAKQILYLWAEFSSLSKHCEDHHSAALTSIFSQRCNVCD